MASEVALEEEAKAEELEALAGLADEILGDGVSRMTCTQEVAYATLGRVALTRLFETRPLDAIIELAAGAAILTGQFSTRMTDAFDALEAQIPDKAPQE